MRRKRKDPIQALQERLEARFPTLEGRVVPDMTSVPAGSAVSILARKAPGRPAVRIERRVEARETGAALQTLVEGIGEEAMRKLRAVDPG